MIKKKFILSVFVVCFLFSGCKKTPLEVEKACKEKTLLVGIGPDPEGLDPQLVTGVTEQNVLRALFEGLVKSDPETLEPQPGVSDSWTISEDGLRYAFHIRSNACWSNGDKLSASDFLFSFQRLLTPSLGTTGANSFFCIKNAQAFYQGKLPFSSVGISVQGETLVFELEQPTPYFLSLLMQPAAYPVHQKTLQKYNGDFSRDPTWTQAKNFVSNGAFKLNYWKVGENLLVEKNPYYWNKDNVYLNKIKFKPIGDVSTEERAFRRGQLHITENVPYAKIKSYYLSKDPALKVHPYLGTFYYLFNTTIFPLNDVRVRKALNLALNRDALMSNDLFQIKHCSAFQLVPEGCCKFKSKAPLQENTDLARQLLAEAGFPNGKGFPKLSLIFNTSEGQVYLASAIQEMWKKELNIDIELINLEWKVYLSKRRARNFQLARGGWVGDYNDPTTFLDLWLKDNPNNYAQWSNEHFDTLLEQAKNEVDAEKRISILEAAEQILLEEVPFLPIHSSATSHLVHHSVKNWYPNLLDWHPYDCIRF